MPPGGLWTILLPFGVHLRFSGIILFFFSKSCKFLFWHTVIKSILKWNVHAQSLINYMYVTVSNCQTIVIFLFEKFWDWKQDSTRVLDIWYIVSCKPLRICSIQFYVFVGETYNGFILSVCLSHSFSAQLFCILWNLVHFVGSKDTVYLCLLTIWLPKFCGNHASLNFKYSQNILQWKKQVSATGTWDHELDSLNGQKLY